MCLIEQNNNTIQVSAIYKKISRRSSGYHTHSLWKTTIVKQQQVKADCTTQAKVRNSCYIDQMAQQNAIKCDSNSDLHTIRYSVLLIQFISNQVDVSRNPILNFVTRLGNPTLVATVYLLQQSCIFRVGRSLGKPLRFYFYTLSTPYSTFGPVMKLFEYSIMGPKSMRVLTFPIKKLNNILH